MYRIAALSYISCACSRVEIGVELEPPVWLTCPHGPLGAFANPPPLLVSFLLCFLLSALEFGNENLDTHKQQTA